MILQTCMLISEQSQLIYSWRMDLILVTYIEQSLT